MTLPLPIVRVAIPTRLRQSFDYLLPDGFDPARLAPGMRVKVPFGRLVVIGMVLELGPGSQIDPARLKPLSAVLDAEPLLPADILRLMLWASSYYHHPPGEVLFAALPLSLRQGAAVRMRAPISWRITSQGLAIRSESLARAPRQAVLLRLLQQHPEGVQAAQCGDGDCRVVLRKLVARGWAETFEAVCSPLHVESGDLPSSLSRSDVLQPGDSVPVLNEQQAHAVAQVQAALGRFQTFLVDGVTGSGKTEVYLRLIEQVTARGQQALVLVPEIGLTPQFVERFQRRFQVPLAVLHSGLSDQARLRAWLMARDGSALIVLGTRSAVFTPLLRPGIVIIDEEHDVSFKQQEGFRYHARDVAVMRAQAAGIAIVLGSATPSLESLHNVQQGRYQRLVLAARAGGAQPPSVGVIDMRHAPVKDALSQALIERMREHLENAGQVLLFLNRRGYAPSLMCHDCGWLALCSRCDTRMVIYRQVRHLLRCHHCAAERPLIRRCPDCQGSNLHALGQGTERVEQTLRELFPHTGVVRIDRDSTRRKGAMQAMLDDVHAGRSQILIGTQMLAKGHHLPNVTLVGILDADQGLFGMDFRASERLAQLIVQVAGRAGRSDKPGQVLIQTWHPDHPWLRALLSQGYAAFAENALLERRQAELPPYSSMALLRATALDQRAPQEFLEAALAQGLATGMAVQLLGPVPAPMERRAGRYRAQLLVQATQRSELQRFLVNWIPQLEALKLARKVRWSIDVDPMEML